jgi:ribosomal protein S21
MSYNVRVEAKRLPPNASRNDRDRSLQTLLKILKRACNEYGIPNILKEKEFFQRPCDIRRRKREAKKRAPLLAEEREASGETRKY